MMSEKIILYLKDSNHSGMKPGKFIRRILGQRHNYLPVFAQQATYIVQASEALYEMTETLDGSQWRKFEKENTNDFSRKDYDIKKKMRVVPGRTGREDEGVQTIRK